MPAPLPPSAPAEPRDSDSDAYWRVLFRQAVDPMLVYPLDPDGRPLPYVEVNDAALALYGYAREEMLSMSVHDLVDAEREFVDAAVASLLTQPDLLLRGHHLHRDGRRIPVEVHARLIDLDRWPAVFAVVRDLTPRLQAEAEAHRRDLRFAEVIGRTSDDVLILNRDWQILYLNAAAVDAVGPKAEGVEGRVLWEAFPELLGTRSEVEYRRAMETRQPVTFEWVGVMTGRYVEVRIYPTEDGLVVFGRDFTERYRAEARQRHQSERLRALAEASLAVAQAATLPDKLRALTEAVRSVVRAHYAVVSLTEGSDWRQAVNAVSLSEKYAARQGYDRPPDGSAIFAELCRTNAPLRLTREELSAHPLRQAFREHADADPPMNGWLAVPLVGRSGENLGLLQASDKEEGPFTENDEAALVQLAQFASAAVEAARAEQARLEAAERFRVIVRQALVGVAQVDLQGRFTYVNDRFAEIVGYAPEELLGLPMQEITHPEDLPRNLPSFHETATEGAPFIIEKRYVRKDGSHVWVSNTVGPLLDPAGRPFAVLKVVLDVTARRRQEEALRESEARYRALTELSPQLVYTARPDGSVDYYNQQWFDYTGMTPDDPFDEWILAVHPDHRRRAHDAFLAAIEAGTDYEAEIPLRRRDGVYRWYLDRARAIRGEGGEVVRWIGVAVDTHDRVEAQAQLEALNASLEARVAERTAVAEGQARQIRQLAAELTRVEQRERRRIATTLHDHLQQLLAAARFHLQSSPARPPALVRADELLAESIEVSRSLTAQLSPPVLHEAGLGAALDWLARWMHDGHGLTVALTVDPEAEPEDEHVRVLLFEAVRELLFNIVKHAGVTEAEVRMEPHGPGCLRITVRDTGVGFVASPSPPTPSGIGLPSIRERLSYVGGGIAIESQPGHGTLVSLTAPRVAASPSLSGPSPRPAPADREAGPPLNGAIRVLLVDDHHILRAGLTSLLRLEPGIEIVGEAGDGLEAVDLALTLEPDVILMDVTMPRMGGIEATRRITDKLPNVRVVGLSMHTEADMASRLREAGAAAYLTKGGPPRDLVRTIREVAGQG